MNYDRETIEDAIREACEKLLREQPMLFQIAHDVNERTVSMELSAIIRDSFKGFHTNCEYNRMTDEYGTQIPKRINLNPDDPEPSRVFPDIIVHRQDDGDHNLLIVEIKLSWKNARMKEDINKLQCYIAELGYRYGLYLELGQNGVEEMVWLQ